MTSDRLLSHIDATGAPRMVDVSAKPVTMRSATASAVVHCDAETAHLIASGGAAKGDVVTTARLAGIMGAKRTSDIIPMCHPLPLTLVEVHIDVDEGLPGVRISARVDCEGRTGVEMEALTAVTVAGLTVIDMAKSADPWMTLDSVQLETKQGGRHGAMARPAQDAPSRDG